MQSLGLVFRFPATRTIPREINMLGFASSMVDTTFHIRRIVHHR